MRRLAGMRAKIFYWLSGAFYEKDPDLTAWEMGLFDGIKLHELEGHWVEKRPEALRRVRTSGRTRRSWMRTGCASCRDTTGTGD